MPILNIGTWKAAASMAPREAKVGLAWVRGRVWRREGHWVSRACCRARRLLGTSGSSASFVIEILEVVWHLDHAIEHWRRWPEAPGSAKVALLPKDGGLGLGTGTQRPIMLLPFLYRLWAAARKDVVRLWVQAQEVK